MFVDGLGAGTHSVRMRFWGNDRRREAAFITVNSVSWSQLYIANFSGPHLNSKQFKENLSELGN